jgi:glycosyltransferase involved in cell wall biosynthesis
MDAERSPAEHTKGYNVHVYPNPIAYPTRLEKLTRSIAATTARKIVILGIHESHLPYDEFLSEDVVIKRFPLVFGAGTRSTFLKVLQAMHFSFRAFCFCICRHVEAVNVHTLSLLPLGVLLKCMKGTTIVYDIHELETEKLHWRGFRRQLGKLVESCLISHVAQVVVVSPSIAEWYKNEYGVDSEVILNAPQAASPVIPRRLFNDHFGIPHDTLIFLYQGSLGPGRSIELLLDVFRNAVNRCIVFLGYGDLENRIRGVASGSRSIFYHPAMPANEILRFTASADVGLALIEDVCLSYRYALPTKFFEYIAAGIPVISSDGVDMKRIIDRYDIGITVADPSYKTLTALVHSLDRRTLSAFRANMRAISQQYTWIREHEKIERIYGRLLPNRT